MSSNRRSRKGRFLPVVGYVGVLGICVYVLYSSSSLLINFLIGQGKLQSNIHMLRAHLICGGGCELIYSAVNPLIML